MLQYLMAAFSNVRSDEEGQTAVEYALVLLLVALVLVLALVALETALDGAVTRIAGSLV